MFMKYTENVYSPKNTNRSNEKNASFAMFEKSLELGVIADIPPFNSTAAAIKAIIRQLREGARMPLILPNPAD